MNIRELTSLIFDKVTIYKANNEDFEDIYKGSTMNIPSNVLEMKVRIIGTSKKGVIDIEVF